MWVGYEKVVGGRPSRRCSDVQGVVQDEPRYVLGDRETVADEAIHSGGTSVR